MDKFELIEALDELRLAKMRAAGVSRLALGMHCLDKDDAWYVACDSMAKAEKSLAMVEERLTKVIDSVE